MRKKIILITVIISTVLSLSAQEYKKHEVRAGIGIVSIYQLATGYVDIFASMMSPLYDITPNKYNAFSPYIDYRYSPARWFSIGATFAYDGNSIKYRPDNSNEEWQIAKRHFPTLAIEAIFTYVNQPSLRIYSTIGSGLTFLTIPRLKLSGSLPNGHISLLGVSFGKTIAGHVELGVGYKGFINAGMSYRF